MILDDYIKTCIKDPEFKKEFESESEDTNEKSISEGVNMEKSILGYTKESLINLSYDKLEDLKTDIIDERDGLDEFDDKGEKLDELLEWVREAMQEKDLQYKIESVLDDYGILYGDVVEYDDKVNIVGVDELEWDEARQAIKDELNLDVLLPSEDDVEPEDELVILKESKAQEHSREEYCVLVNGDNWECYTTEEEAIKQARKWFAEYQDKDPVVEVKLVTYGPKDEYDDEPEIGVETIWSTRFGESLKEDKPMYVKDFCDDAEKMADFKKLSKEEFLKMYSYLTPEEYEATVAKCKECESLKEAEDDIVKASLPSGTIVKIRNSDGNGFKDGLYEITDISLIDDVEMYNLVNIKDSEDTNNNEPMDDTEVVFVAKDRKSLKEAITFEVNDDGDLVAKSKDNYLIIGSEEDKNLSDAEKKERMLKVLKDFKNDDAMKSEYDYWMSVLKESLKEGTEKNISYGIVYILPNDADERGEVFDTEEEAKEFAKTIDKEKYNGYRIMKIESHKENGETIYDDEIVIGSEDFDEEELEEGASYKGMAYYEYKDGCHVRETPTCFVALDEHGTTLGDSKTKAGAEGIIDDYLSRNIQELQGNSNKLKEEKSDYIGMDDIEFYYIISNGNPRQAIILDASTDQDEIIRMAESSKTYNTVSKYFPDGKGGKEEIVWKR